MADWGNMYYATDTVAGLTYQSAQDAIVRNAFMNTGKLPNTVDPNFRPIDVDYPVFGFANDLGNVGPAEQTVLYSIGLAQNASVQYLTTRGNETFPSLWTSYYSSDAAVVSDNIRRSNIVLR